MSQLKAWWREFDDRERGVIIVAALAIILVALAGITGVPSQERIGDQAPTSHSIQVEEALSPPPAAESDCLGDETPFYYANLTFKESPGAFGPPATPEFMATTGQQDYDRADLVSTELYRRLCGAPGQGGDPMLFQAIQSAVLGHMREFNPNTWKLELRRLVEMLHWRSGRLLDAATLPAEVFGSSELLTMSASWPNGRSNAPVLARTSYNATRPGAVLRLEYGSDSTGGVVYLRLACGFQPILSPADFPRELT